jgi:hypothetical protein
MTKRINASPLRIALAASFLSIAVFAVEIPSSGGFFYATLNSEKKVYNGEKVDSGYLYVNATIAGQDI